MKIESQHPHQTKNMKKLIMIPMASLTLMFGLCMLAATIRADVLYPGDPSYHHFTPNPDNPVLIAPTNSPELTNSPGSTNSPDATNSQPANISNTPAVFSPNVPDTSRPSSGNGLVIGAGIVVAFTALLSLFALRTIRTKHDHP
jgi:hypothetical protein